MENEIYTYYRIDFKDCNLDFDYTIVEKISDIEEWILFLDTELDDPTKIAQITITGVGLTRTEFDEFQKRHARLT